LQNFHAPIEELPEDVAEANEDHPLAAFAGNSVGCIGTATCIGRKQKMGDLHAILEVCLCGQAVTDGEVLKGEDVIKCKSVGCETGWVSVKIPREQDTQP
jgi:hypothetical protein